MTKRLVQIRESLIANLSKEFIGPGSEAADGESTDSERISESPLKRYALGILYPQRAYIGDDVDNADPTDEDDNESPDVETPVIDLLDEQSNARKGGLLEEDQPYEQSLTAANQFCPSSMGITFFLKGESPSIQLFVSSAKYRRLEESEAYVSLNSGDAFLSEISDESFLIKDGKFFFRSSKTVRALRESLGQRYWQFSRIHDKSKSFMTRGYRRLPQRLFMGTVELKPGLQTLKSSLPDEYQIKILCRTDSRAIHKVTISTVNLNAFSESESKYSAPEKCFFQNSIEVTIGGDCVFHEVPRLGIAFSADLSDNLLYRKNKVFGVGHGCSIEWDDAVSPRSIHSTFLPTHEVPKVNPFPKSIENLRLRVFDMGYLAFDENTDEILGGLGRFAASYEDWIRQMKEEANGLSETEKEIGERNIGNCEAALDRIRRGLETLRKDKLAWEAFRLANEAMTMQRYHSEYFVKKPRSIDDPPPSFPDYTQDVVRHVCQWRPFQLAFLLLCVESITNDNSPERDIADLIWFPTGGGKTEAYLGTIAFTIFYRRLRHGSLGFGTAIIMRYTLRLLTAQQYERASTLICACETIRSRLPEKLGTERITIGLWVGRENTPNSEKQAREAVQLMITSPGDFVERNPFQVSMCPWCGTQLFNSARPAKSGYVSYPNFHIKCIEVKCPFNASLPLQVVDERIYAEPPTLLFATVDKFARLAWEPASGGIFGFRSSNNDLRPPELILQDELHLITGPLGSLFGLYETSVDYLCSRGTLKPKIVCSTATVKRADEQVRLLFDRKTSSFPPSGLDISDTFFSEEVPTEQSPGRLYVGLMSVGITQTSAQVKALACLLYHNYEIEESFRDKYYTLVCYFNTIKELGHTASLLDADIVEKVQTLQSRFRTIFKRPMWRRELTSREHTSELPKTLKQLEKELLPSPNTIPILLSTNMFSVGVDISRLNLLFMAGQPKSTSEYIQSTSRVGRSDPGLVVVMFDGFRPRDRSHFENFRSFHQSFYRFVEPSGVTPFSQPARNRALHTLLIIAMRLKHGLPGNGDARRFRNKDLPAELTQFLRRRIKDLDENELDEAMKEWENNSLFWENRTHDDLVYSVVENPYRTTRSVNQANPLMRSFEDKVPDEKKMAWPVLNSLRSVDTPCVCVLED